MARLLLGWKITEMMFSGTMCISAIAHLPYPFLTCEANEVVRPIDAKAIPVTLAIDDDRDAWLDAPPDIAVGIQKPCPKDTLRIAAARLGASKMHDQHIVSSRGRY